MQIGLKNEKVCLNNNCNEKSQRQPKLHICQLKLKICSFGFHIVHTKLEQFRNAFFNVCKLYKHIIFPSMHKMEKQMCNVFAPNLDIYLIKLSMCMKHGKAQQILAHFSLKILVNVSV